MCPITLLAIQYSPVHAPVHVPLLTTPFHSDMADTCKHPLAGAYMYLPSPALIFMISAGKRELS